MDQNQVVETPPPPAASSYSSTSFLVLALSILGILTTSILLLGYYLFITKCCLHWRRSDVVVRFSRSRTRHHGHRRNEVLPIYSTTFEGRGLEESAIRQIPTFRYNKGGVHVKEHRSFHECAVCLNEFQEEERIRLLPNCFHVFHIDCIDTWLQTNATCPMCRSAITACPIQLDQFLGPIRHGHQNHEEVLIQVRDDHAIGHDQEMVVNKLHKITSMGDECIAARSKLEDDLFSVQPMRRSLSMDSSSDKQFYLALQKILQQQNSLLEVGNGEGCSSSSSSNGGGGRSGRMRRSFLSFSQSRSSRSAVLPVGGTTEMSYNGDVYRR